MFYPEQSRSLTLEQLIQSGLSSGLEECLAVGRKHEAQKLGKSGLRWVVLRALCVLTPVVYVARGALVILVDFQPFGMKYTPKDVGDMRSILGEPNGVLL